MSFNDYWVLILPFFGAIVGIIFAQFLSLRKNIGLKLILSFSGAFLLGITVFQIITQYLFRWEQAVVCFRYGWNFISNYIRIFLQRSRTRALSPKRIRYLSVDLVVEFKYTCIGGRNAFVKSNGIAESSSIKYPLE